LLKTQRNGKRCKGAKKGKNKLLLCIFAPLAVPLRLKKYTESRRRTSCHFF
jgi:hypothetical protein